MAKKNVDNSKKKASTAIENPEILADIISHKSEVFFEKNKTLVLSAVAAIALAVGGFFGYQYWISTQDAEAQEEMFQAVYYFEASDFDKALNGDGNNYGFVDIISNYGGTNSAELAAFYAGNIYMKKGEFDLAIDYLKDFSASDLIVQARAYSLIGDAYMEKGDFSEAASYYEKAASYKPNKFFSPSYLVKAALAYEKGNDLESAKKAYDKIVTDYSDASEYQNALKHKSRLEGLTSK